MSTAHSKAAKEFLKNEKYSHWHDATFWSVRTKRDNMAHGLKEWEQLREKASAIKRHTISHLDEYLDQFATNAEKNGCIVHWAKDADEFNEIVYGILKDHNVKKLVKSKSMLTEECEMNPYLEAKGIEVVETDLGERIIQLKGQKPSHIVMPAIHLNHDDVGELFEEKLGTEKGNHDPTYLTYQARLSLRNEFLTADAGMTGGNFGIAATGDIVVCTNEGNADMSTSCPKLHIAAVGLEKIIPNYDCLAVFQRMLCRAGTGQPTTTYTSHFRKARPTAAACTLCLSCQTVCPVKINLGDQIYQWRQQLDEFGTANPQKKMMCKGMNVLFGSSGMYNTAMKFAPMANWVPGFLMNCSLNPWAEGGHEMMKFPRNSFQELWRKGKVK